MMRPAGRGDSLTDMPATRVRHVAVLLTGAALAAAGCGGDSEAEQTAQATVCDARTSIGESVDALQAMTPETVTADSVRTHVDSIRADLQAIRGAQGELSEDRRAEIKQANDEFAAEVRNIATTILRSTSVAEARAQVKGAVDELKGVYRTTLATVDCG